MPIFPDLERELHGDLRQQIAEIERKNRQTDAARELVARVVASRQETDGRRTRAHLRQPRGANATRRQLAPLNPKPPAGRPRSDPEREMHWGAMLLQYVRQDTEGQREAWRANE